MFSHEIYTGIPLLLVPGLSPNSPGFPVVHKLSGSFHRPSTLAPAIVGHNKIHGDVFAVLPRVDHLADLRRQSIHEHMQISPVDECSVRQD